MSAVTDDLGDAGSAGPSLESFYHKLYDPNLTQFHTEIEHPEGMTVADVYAQYLMDHQLKAAGKVLQGFQKWKRINYVAKKRKRAEETVKVAQAQAEAEKARKDWGEALTGLKR